MEQEKERLTWGAFWDTSPLHPRQAVPGAKYIFKYPVGWLLQFQVCLERLPVHGDAVWLNALSGAWLAGWWLFLNSHSREKSTANIRLLFQKVSPCLFCQRRCWLKCSSDQTWIELMHSDSLCGCSQMNQSMNCSSNQVLQLLKSWYLCNQYNSEVTVAALRGHWGGFNHEKVLPAFLIVLNQNDFIKCLVLMAFIFCF